MVIIYSHTTSARLQYISHFIFKMLLGLDCRFTIDSQEFINTYGVKINYSTDSFTSEEVHVVNKELLFETNIEQQQIDCFETNSYPAFFKTENGHFPFDIFAASFYLLSRYEEYLPHQKDMYGRYAHENSVAFKSNFLQLPLINIWVKDFAQLVQRTFPHFAIEQPASVEAGTFFPTYDIDIAYSFRHKGLLRNAGSFLRSPSLQRLKVLSGLQQDPFDCYNWLNSLHQRYSLQAHYFFLVAEKNGRYDKNILPHKTAMWKLVKKHARKYPVGIHPSWQSGDRLPLLAAEKELLEAMAEKTVTSSRQHYIRFNLPEGYRRLTELNITDDYSMGYGSINGFRASVASSFHWYDLEREEQSDLLIHPFCFMEANSFYEQHFSAQQALEEMKHYHKICRSVNGTFISIWHNNFLGTDPQFAEWRDVYEKFIGEINQ
ncbi:MAG: polysaccharide deacetylase family protein [Ferruginibacter sp.]